MLVSIVVLNNCNTTPKLTNQTEALFRDKWKLTEVQGQQVPDSVRSRFEFTPGRISGSAGCHALSAGFIAGRRQTVTFYTDAPPKEACGNENAAALETRFLEALSKSTKWDIKGSELWLGDGATTLIKLKSF